jgi:hypothetical protein
VRALVLGVLSALMVFACSGPSPTGSAATAQRTGESMLPATSGMAAASPSPISSVAVTPSQTTTPSETPRPAASEEPEQTARPPRDFFSDHTLDAALARCPTAAEVAWVDGHVSFTFEHDPTGPNLVCTAAAGSADLTHLQERAYQSILTIRRIQFDAPLPWTDLTLWRWFDGEVNGITYREGGSHCCDGPGVLVIQSDGDRSSLQSDYWIDRREPQAFGLIYEVQLLLHEARHVAGYPHCGVSGNDATLEEGGAWAVVHWFATYLAEHTNSYMAPRDGDPNLYTAYARELAASALGRIGCTD